MGLINFYHIVCMRHCVNWYVFTFTGLSQAKTNSDSVALTYNLRARVGDWSIRIGYMSAFQFQRVFPESDLQFSTKTQLLELSISQYVATDLHTDYYMFVIYK